MNITPNGDFFISYRDKIWILEGFIFEKIYTTEKLWDGLMVSWK